MKKILIFLIGIIIIIPTFAADEHIATSKAFVDSAVAQKQDKIPANNGVPQILMNTGTPGNVGTKDIYDSNGSYAEQTDALITAGDFNTALQNAIDSEFECVGWNPRDQNDCWFVKIRGTPVQSVLPLEYTQLEYIEGTGTQWIDTGISATTLNSPEFYIDFSDVVLVSSTSTLFGGGYDTPGFRLSYYPTYGWLYRTPNGLYYQRSYGLNVPISDSLTCNMNGVTSKNTGAWTYRTDTNTIGGNIRIFRVGSGKLRKFSLKDGENMLFDGYPARRNIDNKVGMYDTVSETFFTSAGTGTFIAGPTVYIPQNQ